MASKQLYEDFYYLLESPEHQELSAPEIGNSPRDPDSSPPLRDAPGKEATGPRLQDDDQSSQICIDLFTKFNIDPYPMGSIPGLDYSTAHLLVRSELEQILFSDELPRRTKHELEDRLSYYMRCGGAFGSRMSREEAVATQDTLLLKGSVTFADLPKIFLIGDIVYTADPTPLKDTLFEQCWVAVDCELVTANIQKDFLVSVKKWGFDAKSDNGWYLESAEVMIYGYKGEKSIQLADIGVVPLKSLPAEEQRTLSDRMIARGRLYLEMSQIKIGFF
ncbi:hypothetical protein GCG54_00013641 [Colletotrichum gloeosporioides]|uniref:Uncharacterized protein n=1 Tax=Colletotrichum gloeosporioides TaxID=474922 RepID=A0A8H4FKY2_COLGL|nr:uncharacterized protein GCG54_00013641 [Colletotrichum gloeosporioides]KAF3805967.1 hypothetical protein GCG54_00013641 [Colletotrichum gloeosporioides]